MGLMVDQTEFKRELHKLIDEYEHKTALGERSWREEFESGVRGLVKKHRVHIKVGQLSSQLMKLLLAANAYRAHRLVDALEDRELSKAGAFALNGLFQLFRLGMFVLLILVVLWTVGVL